MADEGPTTVGSIVGKVIVDATEGFATFDEVEARSKGLGDSSPDIDVKVDSASALAKLAAVEAAQRKLATATEATQLAYLKLDEIQSSGTASATKVAAGHLAASKAEDAQASAATRLAAAQAALTASEAAENDEQKKSNGLKNEGFTRITAIVAAVASLIPLIGPLGAYTVAAGGAFASLGTVGLLAILGIKNAMQAGTQTGQQFSIGVQQLKGDLAGLAQTAAVAMLGSFNTAVNTLNDAMPFLTKETSEFSGILGGAGNAALTGAINALQILNPLFIQGATYLGRLALGFQKWTSDGGLQKFATYAETALPQVAQLLGNLATSALNIVQALAPAGTALVGFLNIVANVLDFLSGAGPVFAAVVAGATAGGIAFKLWGSAAPLIKQVAVAIGAVAEAEDLALGPIGLIIAGVTALVAIFAVSTAAATSAADGVDTYTAAVEADNGVIGENVRLQAAKNLQDEGALDTAGKLGIKTNQLVKAALGNNDAMKQVNASLDQQSKKYAQINNTDSPTFVARAQGLSASQRTLKADVDNTKTSLTTQQGAVKAAIKAYNDLQGSLGGTTITTQAQLQAQQDLADSYHTSLSTYEGAVTAQKKTAAQAAATTLQLQLENDAATLLTNAFTILNGGTLDVAQAQTGLYAANNGVTASFKQNKAVVDGSSAAAVANQQAIEGQVTAAQASAEAIGKQTGSSKAAIASYEASKTALEAQLKAQGDLNPSVQAYIDKLYDLKNLKVSPTKLDVDTAAALAKLKALQVAIAAAAKTRMVEFDATGSFHVVGSSTLGRASGGTVDGPGTSTSDSVPLWASRGEEVIKASSAGQARPFLKAFNASPQKALAAVAAGGGGGGVNVRVYSSLGNSLSDFVQMEIEQNGQWQAIHLNSGVAN